MNSSRLRTAGGFGSSSSSNWPSSMNERSAAKAISASRPAKQLPGSISANRLREVVSSRFTVRL